MGKIWVEFGLISARGLRRTSALWKLQWFAVGWIDPNNKYCTKIDASGNANPVWKTKFSILVDSSESNFGDMALHVEVFSREPIFLRERLQGTATIALKEFLDKYSKNSEVSKQVDEVGSFQLRKKKSNKPQGFVDVSIRISDKEEESNSYPGNGEGFKLSDPRNGNNMVNIYGSGQAYPPKYPLAPSQQAENHSPENAPYSHSLPFPPNYSNHSAGVPNYQSAAGPSYQPQLTPRPPPSTIGPGYQPPRTPPPPPPPPPSNVGYISTFNPRTDNLPPSYINTPSSGVAAGRNNRPNLGLGLGAGAVIFGDDLMSGYKVPDGCDLVQAAALPLAYGTSYSSLIHRAQLHSGQVLLVLGAAGGVGLAAVQIGKICGATVIAVARGREKVQLLKSIGADHVVDLSKETVMESSKGFLKSRNLQGVDILYDPVGGKLTKESLKLLNWGAQILVIGFASGEVPVIPTNIALVKNWTIHGFYWGNYSAVVHPGAEEDSVKNLLSWLAKGLMTVHISHVYTLPKVHLAFAALKERNAIGKVMVVFDDELQTVNSKL